MRSLPGETYVDIFSARPSLLFGLLSSVAAGEVTVPNQPDTPAAESPNIFRIRWYCRQWPTVQDALSLNEVCLKLLI